MINKQEHPVGWADLMYELEDAREHLSRLILEIASDPDYGDGNLRVDLAHVYAHLNRAWHGRNAADGLPDKQRDSASQFPQDLEPV
jgi:hypothetical protein